MNSFPLTTLWLQILALIAAEIGIVVLLVAAGRRWCRTAVWRKTLCQAVLIACVAIACSELSGAGRSLMSKFFWKNEQSGKTTLQKAKPLNPADGKRENAALANSSNSFANESAIAGARTDLELAFRAKVMEQLARNQSRMNSGSEPAVLLVGRGPSSTHSAFQRSEAKDSIATDSAIVLSLVTILAGGTAVVFGRACLGRLLLILLGTRRKAVTNVDILQQVALIANHLRISRRIRIIESSRLVSPIAFGFIRPTVGLPLHFGSRFSRAKQEAMLTHELAHLAAQDPLWYFLADVLSAVLWWHPGIWWLRRQLQLSSELAADEASLMSPDGPRILAECLVEMGAQLAKPVPGQLRVAGFRSDLGRRVQQLMRLEGVRWVPVSRARTILARSIGPIAVSTTVILCTAWAVPRQLTQGESMKTMKQNWQCVFATFATMAAIQTPTAFGAQQNSGNAAPVAGLAANPANTDLEGRTRTDLAGAPPAGSGAANAYYPRRPGSLPHGGKLEGTLREIVLDEVKFDGLPLSEALNFLSDESRKRDSEKRGINFLIDPNQPQIAPSGTGSVDPATGLPLAAVSVEPIDVASVNVRFNMALRHVTMADVLDAIVRVADRPIQYTVEDYAVIFSLRPEAAVSVPGGGQATGPAPLVVRTFHVDTNTFVGGLESAFGIKVDGKGKGESPSKKIQAALKELLAQLNVSLEGNKAIFYNELTATVMVRVAVQDLDVIQAAVETLGGQAMGGGYAIGYSPMPGVPGGAGMRR